MGITPNAFDIEQRFLVAVATSNRSVNTKLAYANFVAWHYRPTNSFEFFSQGTVEAVNNQFSTNDLLITDNHNLRTLLQDCNRFARLTNA